jgi:glycosyltransferase involved in cell wall biosynthesis
MSSQRIAVDLYPMSPGRGGTGGGVWRYSEKLLANLDELSAHNGPEIVVYARESHDLDLKNVEVKRVSDFFQSGLGRFLWVHYVLPRSCRRDRVSVLHKLATEVPIYQRGLSVVVTIHDFMAEFQRETARTGSRTIVDKLRQAYFSMVVKLALRTADVAVFPTVSVSDEANERYSRHLKASRVVIANGVDQPCVRRQLGHQVGAFSWIVVASFSPHKGHLEVLEALRALGPMLGEGETVRVVLRGHVIDGEYFDRVKRSGADLPENVVLEFADFDSEASEGEVYESSDGLILLSRYEGFGLPPVEAQAHGMPVLVSDIPVFRETLGAGAVYVSADDSTSVAEAMLRIMRQSDTRADLIAQGMLNAADYTWSRTAADTLRVYSEVLARKVLRK